MSTKIQKNKTDEKVIEKIKTHDKAFTSSQIAKECGVKARRVRKMLNFLICVGTVEKTEDGYGKPYQWKYCGKED